MTESGGNFDEETIKHLKGLLTYLDKGLKRRNSYYGRLVKNLKPGDELRCAAPIKNKEHITMNEEQLLNNIPHVDIRTPPRSLDGDAALHRRRHQLCLPVHTCRLFIVIFY